MRTVDLVDAHEPHVHSCSLQFNDYGAVRSFAGTIRTVRVFEDNALIRLILQTPGGGAVLVIDGNGSLRTALAGDKIVALALANGWSGLLINGAVRDVRDLGALPIGIKALGSNPMKSAKTGKGDVDVPVTFGGVTFTPHEYVYGDEDGVLAADHDLVSDQ